jgi:CubicO group peptidase (beta-lactamase class C family)
LVSEHETFDRNSFFKSVLLRNKKAKSKPNEKFAYSNLGYVILGQLIESVSGKTYEDYITENIIRKLPLNPNDLTFIISDTKSHATGYHKRKTFSSYVLGFFMDSSKFMEKAEGKWQPFKSFYVNGVSYGGLIGNPTAFVKYIQELLKDNSSLIPAEFRQLLFQENKSNSGKETGMCLSWFTGQLNGNKYFTHAGGGGGYYCEIRIYPDLKIGSVIFFNRTGMSDERYLDKLDRFYIKGKNTGT